MPKLMNADQRQAEFVPESGTALSPALPSTPTATAKSYCGWMPAFLMTPAHFSMSAFIVAAVSLGVVGAASAPRVSKRVVPYAALGPRSRRRGLRGRRQNIEIDNVSVQECEHDVTRSSIGFKIPL